MRKADTKKGGHRREEADFVEISRLSASAPRRLRSFLVRIDRQAHRSSRNFARPRCDFQGPPVRRRNPARDAQAKAAALYSLAVTRIAAEKRIENAGQYFGRD